MTLTQGYLDIPALTNGNLTITSVPFEIVYHKRHKNHMTKK